MAKNTVEIIIAAKDQASKAINKISNALTTGLKVAAGVAAVAITSLTVAMVKGVRLANVQEDAELKLAAALRAAGIATEENYKHLTKYASGLQAVTRYGDEATLQAQALLIQLGNLRGEGLDRATMASANFAAALGMSIEQAAMLVAKGAEMPSMLSRYGIRIDENIPKGEKFNAVLAEIEKKFGGSAQAMVGNYSGRMAQLSNTVGDTFESFGMLVTRNTVVLEAIKELKGFFEDLGKVIDENREAILRFVKDALIFLIDKFKIAISTVDKGSRIFGVFRTAITAGGKDIKDVLAEMERFKEAPGYIEKLKQSIDDITEKLKNLKAEAKDTAQSMIEDQKAIAEETMFNFENAVNTEEIMTAVKEENERRRQDAVKATQQAEQERNQILAAAGDLMIQSMKAMGAKGKAIALASAIINTAKAVTQVLPNIPLAVLIAAKGAAEIATISAQKMAKGGIITKPTLVLAGEAGPEAFTPLPTGKELITGKGFSLRGDINISTADRLLDMDDREVDDFFERTLLPSMERLSRRGITVS